MYLRQCSVSTWILFVSLCASFAFVQPTLDADSDTLSADTTVAVGDTLTVDVGDTLIVPAGVSLTIEGALLVLGELEVSGHLNIHGHMTIEGELEADSLLVYASGSIDNHGVSRLHGSAYSSGIFKNLAIFTNTSRFENYGHFFNNGDALNIGHFVNQFDSLLTNQKTFITDNEFENYGEVRNRFTPTATGLRRSLFHNIGDVYNASDASFLNTGSDVENESSFENDGEVRMATGGAFTNRGLSSSFLNGYGALLLIENGQLDNEGDLTNAGGLIENGDDGVIINRYNGLSVAGYFTQISCNNPGEIVNRGAIVNESGLAIYGVFRNGGGLVLNYCDATVTNSGNFHNTGGAVVNWAGTVNLGAWSGPVPIEMGFCVRP